MILTFTNLVLSYSRIVDTLEEYTYVNFETS